MVVSALDEGQADVASILAVQLVYKDDLTIDDTHAGGNSLFQSAWLLSCRLAHPDRQIVASVLTVQDQWLLLRHHDSHVDEQQCAPGAAGRGVPLASSVAYQGKRGAVLQPHYIYMCIFVPACS